MVNKTEASTKLYLLVFVMSVFIIGIGVYGIIKMKTMNRYTETLYADRVLPVEQLTTVRYNYLTGIIGSAEQVQTHYLSYKEAITQIQGTKKAITANWGAYVITYLTPEEARLASRAAELMRQSAVVINKLEDILKKEDEHALDSIINNGVYPSVNPLVNQLNELINLQLTVSEEVYKKSTGVYNKTLKQFILLIALSLIFAVPFSYYLVRKVKGLIMRLNESNEKIARSEQKYRAIFENAQDVFYQTSLDGVILDVSPSVKFHTGFSREEIIGKSSLSLYYDPADREKAFHLLSANNEVTGYEFRFKSNAGESLYVSLDARLIMNADGSPSHIDGVFRNITERKRMEEELRQSEANHRQMFNLSPAPMWLFDENSYRFLQVNQACVDYYGYSMAEFAGMTINDIILRRDEKNIKKIAGKISIPGPDFMGGGRHVKKSGEIMDVITSSIPVVLNGKKQILLVAIDVTERNRYEQKLTRAAIKAQEDERYEIGGELHDNVCQILATSLITLGMMKTKLPVASKQYFEQTQEFISLASQEIRNLSHRLAPTFFEDATLEDVFESLLSGFNVENKYAISIDFDDATKKWPLSRELQLNLYRILQEQLSNILKYANATTIEIEVTINNYVLQMSIADNGVGFEVENIKGAGIGLANMSRRARLFSGAFTVDSAIGNGCKIMVIIPLSNAN